MDKENRDKLNALKSKLSEAKHRKFTKTIDKDLIKDLENQIKELQTNQ